MSPQRETGAGAELGIYNPVSQAGPGHGTILTDDSHEKLSVSI